MKRKMIAAAMTVVISSMFACQICMADQKMTIEKQTVLSAAEKYSTDSDSVDEMVNDGTDNTALQDGEYSAFFDTDSGMFHVNEACNGLGTLTVENGEMTLHVSLVSKNIVNLFPGSAENAQKDGAVWLQPTEDEVTYSDGWKETVYGFDIPVSVLGEEFDLALLGKKGSWYDHKVSVTLAE